MRALGAVARTMRGGLSPRAYVGAELPDVLALADVVISRNGTGTITELTALGKVAGFVPHATSAGNEQVDNAEHLATNGAAVTLVGDVTAERLWVATSRTRSSSGRDHGRPLRTGSTHSRRRAVTSLPKERGLNPVNGAVPTAPTP